jgi:hypothetical protein
VITVHLSPKRSTLPPSQQSEGGENEYGREVRYLIDPTTWKVIRRDDFQ